MTERHEKSGGGMAQQAGDTFTMDLLAAVAPEKRGRGRPRKENALSDAERARRYRQRVKAKKAREARQKASGHVIRFRGPNGETWTGRGLAPRWITAACAMHHCSKEAFRVAD